MVWEFDGFLEADLSDRAGEEITLRLRVHSDAPLPEDALAWWGSPRLVEPRP